MSNIKKVRVKIKGIRELLQNDSFGKESDNEISKKGKIYNPEKEAKIRLITNNDGICCEKAIHIERAMIKTSAAFKISGNKSYKDAFLFGVFVQPELIPLSSQEWAIDSQPVVINRARIMRSRPKFQSGWELEFIIEIKDERIQPKVVEMILKEAGQFNGIGDYRPRYGLFEVISFELI